jgi:Ca2+/Na+ antiporter
MSIASFMGKKDWTSIFMADVFLLLLLFVTLIGKVITWILIVLLLIMLGLTYYMAFVRKYSDVEEEEMSETLDSMKEVFRVKK